MSPVLGFLGVCLVAVVLKGCAAVTCLYCGKGVQHLYQCSQVQQCQEGQTCYIEHVMPFQGIYTIYLAGCRDVTSCNNTTKSTASVSKRSELVICSECCHHSMCNTQGCGADFVGSTHFIRCYNCPQMYGNKICSSFIDCDNRTQMCQSNVVDPSRHPADPNAVELGCGNRNVCKTLLKVYQVQGIPRDQWQQFCCDSEHLCNWNYSGADSSASTQVTLTHTTTAATPNAMMCPFDDGMCGWSNMIDDEFDWTLHSGATPTDGTGPSADHTLGNQTGKYIFIESSEPRQTGDEAGLISPKLAPSLGSGMKCLHFWYNMNGATVGYLNVYVSQNNVYPAGPGVWSMSGNQGPDWKQAHVTLDSQVDFYVIFGGTVVDSYMGDIALDDIVLTAQPCPADHIIG